MNSRMNASILTSRVLPRQVNGVDMMERSQEELVAMLRSTKQGESVRLLVARPDDGFLPRELVPIMHLSARFLFQTWPPPNPSQGHAPTFLPLSLSRLC